MECVTVHVRVRKERGGGGTGYVFVVVRNLEGRRSVIFGVDDGGGCDVDILD